MEKENQQPQIQASFGKVNDQHDFHEITNNWIDLHTFAAHWNYYTMDKSNIERAI